MKNADSQRTMKSARSPILLKVTTQLTTKTTIPVAKIGKINLALPSIRPSPGSGIGHQASRIKMAGSEGQVAKGASSARRYSYLIAHFLARMVNALPRHQS